MTTSTKKRRKPRVQAPQQREPRSSRPWVWALGGAVVVAGVAAVIGVAVTRSNGASGAASSPVASAPAAGLPNTPDYQPMAATRSALVRRMLVRQ
jgi:hypothetical protein